MKSIFTFFLAIVLFAGVANAQNNTNSNALIGRARGAVGQCLGQAHQLYDGQFNEDLAVVGSCFAGGFLTRVTFSKVIFGPICNPNINPDCVPALPLYFLIATVDFDCEGNIIDAQCYNPAE